MKVAFQDLIDFLGFLFNWDDIVNTKNSLSAFMTAGLTWSAGKVDGIIPDVDQFFKDVRKTIGNTKTDVDKVEITKGTPSDQERNKSIGYNYGNYHMMHGGASESFNTDVTPSSKYCSLSTFVPDFDSLY